MPNPGVTMAGPYNMAQISDVAAGESESLLANKRGRVLPEDSRVKVYANRESVDVTYTITVGATEVLAAGAGAAVNATAGDVPSTRDDLIADTFGSEGEEVLILAQNANVAAQEARVNVFVVPIEDNIAQAVMDQLSGAGLA